MEGSATPYTKPQGSVFDENLLQQHRNGVGDLRMCTDAPEVATNTPNRTIRVTLSSDPKCFRATAIAFRATSWAASLPCVLRADTPDEFRFAALGSKHAGEKRRFPI